MAVQRLASNPRFDFEFGGRVFVKLPESGILVLIDDAWPYAKSSK